MQFKYSSTALQNNLCHVPDFRRNNSFMRIVKGHPPIWRIWLSLLLEGRLAGTKIYRMTQILRAHQDIGYRCAIPRIGSRQVCTRSFHAGLMNDIVGSRTQHSFCRQLLCNRIGAQPLQSKLKNMLHNSRCCFIYQPMVLVFRIFAVTIDAVIMVLHVFLGKSQQRKDCKKSTDDF